MKRTTQQVTDNFLDIGPGKSLTKPYQPKMPPVTDKSTAKWTPDGPVFSGLDTVDNHDTLGGGDGQDILGPEPSDVLMEMMRTGRPPDQDPINMQDPAIDWSGMSRELGLTQDQIQELQIPSVPGGPSLADRLQSMKPGANLGRWHIQVDPGSSRQVRGKLTF